MEILAARTLDHDRLPRADPLRAGHLHHLHRHRLRHCNTRSEVSTPRVVSKAHPARHPSTTPSAHPYNPEYRAGATQMAGEGQTHWPSSPSSAPTRASVAALALGRPQYHTGWVRIQLADVIKTRRISILMGATNAASRGGHRALAIPQSFLHTPSDANPACDSPGWVILIHAKSSAGFL